MDTNVLLSIVSLTIAMVIAGFGCGYLLKARGLLKVSNLSLVVFVAPIIIVFTNMYGMFVKQPSDMFPYSNLTSVFLLLTMPLLFFCFYALVTRLPTLKQETVIMRGLSSASMGLLGLILIGRSIVSSLSPLWWLIGLLGIVLGLFIRQFSYRLPNVCGVLAFLLISSLSTLILMLTIQSTIFIKIGLYIAIWVLPFIYTHMRTKTVSDKGIWMIPLSWIMVIILGFFIQIEISPYLYALMITILMAIMGLKGLELREVRAWWIASVSIQLIWMTQQVFMTPGSLLMWLLAGSLILYQGSLVCYQKRLSVQYFLLASILGFIILCMTQHAFWITEIRQWFEFPQNLYLWLFVMVVCFNKINNINNIVCSIANSKLGPTELKDIAKQFYLDNKKISLCIFYWTIFLFCFS